MDLSLTPNTSDCSESQLTADFARLLAANFAREVGSKENSEGEKSSHDSHEPKIQALPKPDEVRTENPASDDVPEDRSLTAPANNRKGPRLASSRYRGCTRHRRTKRYEAHIWDQRQQRYLGGFDREIDAGKAHDVMALKCRSPNDLPQLNFPMDNYAELLPLIDRLPKEEVVAQLRQLNRTAPRSKGRKPPAKPRSSPNLAGLTTRSGIPRKRGGETDADCQMTMSEEAMASFCRAHRLAPLRRGGDPTLRLPHVTPPLKRGRAEHMESAFATQKDIPLLPHWGPTIPLDCLPQELPDSLPHLGDPADLLADIPDGLLGSPRYLNTAGHQLRSSPATFKSPGPMYVGRTLNAPKSSWIPKGAQGLYNHSQPLQGSYEHSRSLPPPGAYVAKGEAAYDSFPSRIRTAKYPMERSYSHSGGSLHHSLDSVRTQVGTRSEGGFGKTTHHRPGGSWDSSVAMRHGGVGSVSADEQFHVDGSPHGCHWDLPDHVLMRSGQYQPEAGPAAQPSWMEAHLMPSYDPEFGQKLESFENPELVLSRKVEHRASFNSRSPSQQWEKAGHLSPGGPTVPSEFHLAKSEPALLPPDSNGSPFTSMMTQEIPSSDQLDAAVLDVMGSWSP